MGWPAFAYMIFPTSNSRSSFSGSAYCSTSTFRAFELWKDLRLRFCNNARRLGLENGKFTTCFFDNLAAAMRRSNRNDFYIKPDLRIYESLAAAMRRSQTV